MVTQTRDPAQHLPRPPGAAVCEAFLADRSVMQRHLDAGAWLRLDERDHSLLVVEGALAVTTRRPTGRLVIVELLTPGACLMANAEFTSTQKPLSLSALVPCVVARIPRPTFERVIATHPELGPAIAAKMAQQHAELLLRVAALVDPSPTHRMASTLTYLSGGVGGRCPLAAGIQVMLAQHTLAEAADMSRQTANRCLKQLEAMGLIRVERNLVCVLDISGLRAVADGVWLTPMWQPARHCAFVHRGAPVVCVPLLRARRRTAPGQ